MLQGAVDALFDNERARYKMRNRRREILGSLSHGLRGKQGRFRQNLLGKRVDYSGRSVIVVGPELRLHQCGLPKAMALELFKPFIIHKLVEKGIAETVKRAKKIVEKESPEVYEILEEIIRDHPVLLNRAPTLHRLGIQAFEPVLVEGKAIRIHPLVCAAFNADFDGDQMAVHVPLSFEAQLESRLLMLSSNNILKPSDGRPVAEPSQDIVLGCYFATKAPPNFEEVSKTAKMYANVAEVEMAMSAGRVSYSTPIRFWVDDINGARWEATTAGRAMFNAIVPAEIGFLNKEMKKKALGELVFQAYRRAGLAATVQLLDRLKDFGFRNATQSGLTIGIDDFAIPVSKQDVISEATNAIRRVEEARKSGVLNDDECRTRILHVWSEAARTMKLRVSEALSEADAGANPMCVMVESGARTSQDQLSKISGMCGLFTRPVGRKHEDASAVVTTPVTSNYRNGLNTTEYFISTHGARKGLADIALKTADAGYLTRRLVDVAQDVTITEENCETTDGIEVSALKKGESVIEPLSERIVGCVAAVDVFDPQERDSSGRPTLLVETGQLISEETSREIEESGIETVKIRSVLTCEAKRGLCQMCYGRNLATMGMVDKGEAVGIIAAQSIGERNAQLTLRTFHTGGEAILATRRGDERAQQFGTVVYGSSLVVAVNPHGQRIACDNGGDLYVVSPATGGRIAQHVVVPEGAILQVRDGERVQTSTLLCSWDPYINPIVTEFEGSVRFVDIVPDENVRLTSGSGVLGIRHVIEPSKRSKLDPRIEIWTRTTWRDVRVASYRIPARAELAVREYDIVSPGQTIAQLPVLGAQLNDVARRVRRIEAILEVRPLGIRPFLPSLTAKFVLAGPAAVNVRSSLPRFGQSTVNSNGTTRKVRPSMEFRLEHAFLSARATASVRETVCQKGRSIRTIFCASRDRARCRSIY